MRLDDATYEFIKQEVVHLFITHDVSCIPINGFELAYKMGIKLIPYSVLPAHNRNKLIEASKDSFFLETFDQETIYFNDEMMEINYARVNMSLLHEIGHDVLGHTGLKENEEVEETEAGFFARYAAAPPPLVHRIRPSSARDIELHFQLSREAACNAYHYYQKWLHYGSPDYLDYEEMLLSLFDSNQLGGDAI